MDARDWREMSGVGRILFCSGGGVSERASGSGGQRWNTRGKRRRKWSGPRRWRRRQWRKMEKSAGNVGGGEAAAGAGGGGAG